MILAFLLALVFVPMSVNWNNINWGTAPEWIAALALLTIAGGVWRLASVSAPRDHASRDQQVGPRNH